MASMGKCGGKSGLRNASASPIRSIRRKNRRNRTVKVHLRA